MVLNLSQRYMPPAPRIGQAYIPGLRGLSGTGPWPPPDGTKYTQAVNGASAVVSGGKLKWANGATSTLTPAGFTNDAGGAVWTVDWDQATGQGTAVAQAAGITTAVTVVTPGASGSGAAATASLLSPAPATPITSAVGTTDAAGNYAQSGTMAASDAGSWDAAYSVGGKAAGDVTYSVKATPPQIQDFSANGVNADLNVPGTGPANVVLSWNIIGAKSANVDGLPVNVPVGAIAVSPDKTKTYTLYALGLDGSTVTASRTVHVPEVAAIPLSASITNLTQGGGTAFAPGDQYQIRVTGPPNQPVTATIVHSGLSGLAGLGRGTRESGVTDAGGGLVVQGVMGAGDTGDWSEQWWVGDAPAGDLNFQVSPVSPTASAAAASPSSTAQTSPWLLLAAIAAGAYFFAEGVGGKR